MLVDGGDLLGAINGIPDHVLIFGAFLFFSSRMKRFVWEAQKYSPSPFSDTNYLIFHFKITVFQQKNIFFFF